jgi:hypothetical protein
MEQTKFFESKTLRRALWIIGALIVLLVTFKAGEIVGFKRAGFSYRSSERYYRGFGPRGRGMMPMGVGEQDFMMSQGTFGSIVKITSSTLLIADRDNTEKTVVVSNDTLVRRFRDTISIGDLKENDAVIVFGQPNNAGQVEAKLIRILPSSSLPTAPQPSLR